MSPRLRITIACLATLTAARAQDPAAPLKLSILDETLITATRSEASLFDVPYTAHVIGGSDFLGRRHVRTFPDALAETPGVMLQRTGYGQTSPFIRGFTGFRTLALIDGIRLNNAVFREGPNQYWGTMDRYTIDRIEVVKGPSSVLYGSDAIGGTVNAIPRKPPLISWPEDKPAGRRDPRRRPGRRRTPRWSIATPRRKIRTRHAGNFLSRSRRTSASRAG